MKYLFLYTIFITFIVAKELITPIPLSDSYDFQKALLGQKLFFDTKLSHDDTVSCASCHNIADGGDDNLRVSFGIKGQTGTRNSPTVLNARYNIAQFWDASAKDLEAQAAGPIHNPVEMGSNFKEAVIKLKKDKLYQKLFHKIYKDGITGKNITNAIAEFEKTLITPNSRFDKYLKGDKDILTQDEKDGFKTFKEYGCISCHNGINIGGNLIQKIGIINRFDTDDLGRFNITHNPLDKYYFKVPTLRNIALTSPYFHTGRVKKLRDAVVLMVQYQVGFPIDDKKIDNIVKFLNTLTGETPKELKKSK